MIKKTITIIVAAAENDAIGKNNDLIWSLPDDLKRFKKLTSGHCIIMGRKTFDSFPGLLPNRKHIVISKKSQNYFPDEVIVVNSFRDAIKATNEDENPFIIGGGQIYNIAMKYSDTIELTRVHEEFEADTFFPEINEDEWQLINEEKHEMDERHEYSFTYKTYLKIK
tara:strand:- start:1432 stop:1932 length:501 start_codon:yes stop_codon:yes gene_type:complete